MSISFVTISLFGPANGDNAQTTSPPSTPHTIVPLTNLSSIPIYTTPSPAQWNAISSDVASYQTSVESSNPEIASQIASAVPESVFSTIEGLNIPPQATVNSIIAGPEVNPDEVDIAWLTGSTQGVTTRAWETYLDPSLRSAVEAQATSIYQAEQSIVSKDLHAGTSRLLVPAEVEWVLGAVAGVVTILALWL